MTPGKNMPSGFHGNNRTSHRYIYMVNYALADNKTMFSYFSDVSF